ncbi:MAG: T9SS type B sorting domain-containing protein [Aquaticitalea sp.]
MKKITFLFLILLSYSALSQDVLMQNGTVNQCSGNFYDSGGSTGIYDNNQNFVLTICPDNPGQLVQLVFTSFNTQTTDVMTIYNGDSTDLTTAFGSFSGGAASSPGLVIATEGNPTGCLTIEFISDGSLTSSGWAAIISCITPCQTINAQLNTAVPATNADGYINVCIDDPITLTGSGTFSVDGAGASYEWNLGNGTTVAGQSVTFSYATPGIYFVNLYIKDTNTSVDPLGCMNNNLINQVIQVATAPEFTGTEAAQSDICFGDSTTLTGIVKPVEFISDCTPPVSGTTFLPDGNGVTYETSVRVDCFNSAQTLTDISQLVSICLTMEHSYLGDLDIDIISPNGQTVRMQDHSGDSANLGIPWADGAIDGNSGNTTQGIGAQYCFVPGDANPTFVEGIQGNGIFPIENGPLNYFDTFVPAGNYSSVSPLTGLLGSPLNGNWTIRIIDNFGQDNGYIFAWSIDFDPNIQPPQRSFTPLITSESWDADSSIINTMGNTITVQPANAGQHCYTYRVTDDFGCEYTEEVCINVFPEIANAAPNNLFICNPGAPPYLFDLTQNTPILLTPISTSADFVVTYHESQLDSENDTSAIISPNNYSGSDGQIIYVRIENLTTGCFELETFTLNITAQPTINTVSDLVVCDDTSNDGFAQFDLESQTSDILGAQPASEFIVTYYVSFSNANLSTGQLTSPFTNSSNPQPIFVRIERIGDMSCNNVSPLPVFNLGINPSDDASFTVTPTCDGATANATGTLGGTFTFNPVPSDASIIDLDTGTITGGTSGATYTIEYVTSGICPVSGMQTFTVSSRDDSSFNMTPTCDGAFSTITGLPGGTFAFNPVPTDAAVIDSFSGLVTGASPSVSYTVEYTTNGTCPSTSLVTFTVNPLPIVIDPTPLVVCDDNVPDGMTEFDLHGKDNEITGGNSSLLVSYYTTSSDAQTDANVIEPATNYINRSVNGFPANPQTLYVRVTDNITGCEAFTTLAIRVLSNPTPRTDPGDIILCDDINTGDGKEVFDLTANESYILNGSTGVTPSYYTTFEDSVDAMNVILDPANYTNLNSDYSVQTIYVRVSDDISGCYTIVDFDILVNPLPDVIALTDYILCKINNDGFGVFNLASKNAEVLNGQNPSQYQVTYHASRTDADNLINALSSPYSNTINPQRIYVAITNNVTGCSISTPSFEIEVDNAAEANSNGIPIEQVVCDYLGDNDGLAQFDLTENNPAVLDGQDSTNFVVTYYYAEADAELHVNPIPNVYENITNPQIIYVRVDNNEPDGAGMDASICYAVTSLTLKVNLLPIFDLDDSYTLCVDTNGTEVIDPPILDTGLSTSNFTFVWILNGVVIADQTGSSLTVVESGLYEVEVTNKITGCSNKDNAEVVESAPPTLTAEVATLAFAEDSVIEAIATGVGNYEFSLDDGSWQDNGIFEKVTSGEHVILARDKNGCGLTSVVLTVLDYPHFFTPNGDGFNETWNIIGFAGQTETRIFIFDRFGKLLKQIGPSGQGWNGTFNGELMPTNDYWFTVEYSEPSTGEPKKFNGHFTLKR